MRPPSWATSPLRHFPTETAVRFSGSRGTSTRSTSGDALYSEETRLKFGYVLKAKRWVPQHYYDAPYVQSEYGENGRLRYDPFDPDRSPFNSRCIHCHNTYPYEIRLYTGEMLQGFPPAPARMVDRLLESRPA